MNDNISGNKRIAKNTGFLYVRMAVVLFISLYTSKVILNTLGVQDYGIYNVVAGFVSMFGFLNASITACIQRFYNYEIGQKGDIGMSRVFTMSCLIEFIIAIFVLLLLEVFGFWYINNKLVVPAEKLYAANILFQLSTLQMIIVMFQAPFSGVILAKEKMDFYAAVGVVDVVLKLIIVIVLPYLLYDSLIVFGCLMTIISIVDFFLYSIYARMKFNGLRLLRFWDRGLFCSMLSFSGWNIFGAIAMVARTQGLNLLLNLFFGPVVNAARGVATQIQGALMGFIGNIGMAARPQAVESYAKGNINRSRDIMFSISKICFLFLFILALPVSLNIDIILRIWLGNAIPDYTNIFTILILCTALIDVLNTPVTMLIMATGKVKKYCLYTSIGGLMVIPIAYLFLIMGESPSSSFVAGIIISVVVQIISIVELKRLVGISIPFYLNNVVLPLAGTAIISTLPLCIFQFFTDSCILFFSLSVVYSITVVPVVSYFFCLNTQEKNLVKSYMVKMLNRIK